MTVQKFYIGDDGQFPNNIALPVLLYKGVLKIPVLFPALKIKKLFKSNNWYNSWQSGIFTYQHYHSNTHEVMGCYDGETDVQLGGKNGVVITLQKGDVLIIPAGVAHKNLKGENDISCVGAYPNGVEYEIKRGTKRERPRADENIATVSLPDNDPVFGPQGRLFKYWESEWE